MALKDIFHLSVLCSKTWVLYFCGQNFKLSGLFILIQIVYYWSFYIDPCLPLDCLFLDLSALEDLYQFCAKYTGGGGGGGEGHISERDIHSKQQSAVTFKTIDSRGTGFTSG